jgi:hypothetical protein
MQQLIHGIFNAILHLVGDGALVNGTVISAQNTAVLGWYFRCIELVEVQ